LCIFPHAVLLLERTFEQHIPMWVIVRLTQAWEIYCLVYCLSVSCKSLTKAATSRGGDIIFRWGP